MSILVNMVGVFDIWPVSPSYNGLSVFLYKHDFVFSCIFKCTAEERMFIIVMAFRCYSCFSLLYYQIQSSTDHAKKTYILDEMVTNAASKLL